MLFNSLSFCGFFLLVTVLYYVLPWRLRWKMLLAASCLFYMAFIPAYILILFGTILIDYSMGILIARSAGRRRLVYLQISILSTCLVLFVFKYFNFFAMTGRELQGILGTPQTFPITHIILPIGLSFHTFQGLSYVIEVYRGKQVPERHLGIYALYVMFFPQLVAGPIERPQNMLHQFYEDHCFKLANLANGLTLIGWGFFQKMVIADRAAIYVNNAYGHWSTSGGLTLFVATVLFAVQIYADFSGYSCIAVGCARVLGIQLTTNFNHPYFSTSLGEFWKRWHISLSTWFRDYVYIPLGGNRGSVSRHYLNLLITFTISGLWHGANWTFAVWGLYNGLLLVLENYLTSLNWRLPRNFIGLILRRALTVGSICFGWIFFRAPNLEAALGIIRRIAVDTSLTLSSIKVSMIPFSGDSSSIVIGTVTCLLIAIMLLLEFGAESDYRGAKELLRGSLSFQFATTLIIFESVMLFGVLRASAFIYFQF